MGRTWSIVRAYNGDIIRFLAVFALDVFVYFGVQAVLFNLYLLRLGFGPEFIGLLNGSGQLVWAVCALPAAAVSRRTGLRWALCAGMALPAFGMALLLLVEALPRSVWESWLIGWWAVMWVGFALFTVSIAPYVMRLADAAIRDHVFVTQQAVWALAAFVGSLVAGVLPGLVAGWTGDSLLEPAPYRAVLWLVPLGFLVCALGLAGPDRAPPAPDRPAGRVLPAPPISLFVVLGLVVFLQSTGEGAVRAFFNVYLDAGLGVPPGQIGIVMGLAQLLPVAVVLVTPRLLARWGASGTLVISSLGTMVALVPLAVVPMWEFAALGFMGVMTAVTIGTPARNIFSQELAPARWRTTISAVVMIGMALGWGSTAAAGGFVVGALGFPGLFLLSAGLALTAALIIGYWRVRSADGVRPARAS